MVKWSLVSMVHGIPETVLPFVAHHLQSDAEEIFLFLDGPNPALESALSGHPRIRLTVCDAAWWQKRKDGRPPRIVPRQLYNFRQVRTLASTDWLVHVDADEFLVPVAGNGTLSLSSELARLPDDIVWAKIPNVERVLRTGDPQRSIFDGIFRAPSHDKALLGRIYGENERFLQFGLAGHPRGKVALRREADADPRIHDVLWSPGSGKPRPEGPRPPRPEECPPFRTLRDTVLLHFDGWTSLQWLAKLFRMIEAGTAQNHGPGRANAMKFVTETADPAARSRMFYQIRELAPEAVALLAARGLARVIPFDAEEITRRTFPGVDLDFSAAAFDARLRASDPDFFARNGLA